MGEIIIIGGGPAGLSSAYELSKNNVHCVVFEKEPLLGGIAKTIQYKGYYFDLGGHRFFTKNNEVNMVWHELLKKDFAVRPRLSRIYYKGKFYNYPIKIFEALRNLGILQSIMIILSFARSKLFPYKDEKNFEQWVSNRFGRRLYEIFFKSYTEKVWGIPCTEISSEWAAQRIKDLSFISAVFASVFKNSGIKTLIDKFEYPKYGPGMMWDAMASYISNKGGDVRKNAEMVKVNVDNGMVKSVSIRMNGIERSLDCDNLISALPLKDLINMIEPAPDEKVVAAANGLNYRSFIMVALMIDEKEIFPDNWIYIHSPEVKLGRIQNFKNWSEHMVPDAQKTCLGLEYFCFEGDALWRMPDEEIMGLGVDELIKLGIIRSKEKVFDGKVVRVPKAYPVYDPHYQKDFVLIKDHLTTIKNLQVIGRNGMHRYNNMDHSMLSGIMAARNVMGGNNDIWNINTDDEYHEGRR